MFHSTFPPVHVIVLGTLDGAGTLFRPFHIASFHGSICFRGLIQLRLFLQLALKGGTSEAVNVWDSIRVWGKMNPGAPLTVQFW